MIAMYPCAGEVEGEDEDDVGDVPCNGVDSDCGMVLGALFRAAFASQFACCSSVDSIVCVME